MADVVDLLQAQHARIEELFMAVLDSEGQQRRERFDELVRLLVVHETAEQEVVHPIGRGPGGVGEAVIDARLAEERDTTGRLARVSELGTDHPDFPAHLLELRDEVLMHAKREERYEFPYLEHNLDQPTLDRLATGLLTAERLAPTRPHPGAETPAEQLFDGPPLATIDRVRDAVREAMR